MTKKKETATIIRVFHKGKEVFTAPDTDMMKEIGESLYPHCTLRWQAFGTDENGKEKLLGGGQFTPKEDE